MSFRLIYANPGPQAGSRGKGCSHGRWRWAFDSQFYTLVRLQSHAAWVNTPEEGILGFEDDRLVTASGRARESMGLSRAAIGKATWSELFDSAFHYGRQELRLRHSTGVCYADLSRKVKMSNPSHGTARSGANDRFESMKDATLQIALAEAGSNISAAARKLGVNRSTF